MRNFIGLDDLAQQVRLWQADTFPAAKLGGAAQHLLEEAKEVLREADEVSLCLYRQDEAELKEKMRNLHEELADVFFLLMQSCTLAGCDLPREVGLKLAKNKKRQWQAANELGIINHVKTQ